MGRRVVRKPVIGLALLWCAGIEISRLWSYKATHVESSDVRKPVKETDFRLCSSCRSRSQAGLCHCTPQLISDQPEPTIARLRYSLGGAGFFQSSAAFLEFLLPGVSCL